MTFFLSYSHTVDVRSERKTNVLGFRIIVSALGPSIYYVRTWGWGGSENGNFPLLYVEKRPYVRF